MDVTFISFWNTLQHLYTHLLKSQFSFSLPLGMSVQADHSEDIWYKISSDLEMSLWKLSTVGAVTSTVFGWCYKEEYIDISNHKQMKCFTCYYWDYDSPAGQVSSAISLQSDGRLADLSVSNSLQPTSDSLLDLDTGWAKLIRPELLQVCYLTSPEEDLSLTELEHVWLLRHKVKADEDLVLQQSK